jgi:hypothetical protein
MNSRLVTTLALALGAGTALAGPSPSASINHRRMADCMTREMTASRTLSYYAAQSLCADHLKAQERPKAQEQLKAQNVKVVANDPLPSVAGR